MYNNASLFAFAD